MKAHGVLPFFVFFSFVIYFGAEAAVDFFKVEVVVVAEMAFSGVKAYRDQIETEKGFFVGLVVDEAGSGDDYIDSFIFVRVEDGADSGVF